MRFGITIKGENSKGPLGLRPARAKRLTDLESAPVGGDSARSGGIQVETLAPEASAKGIAAARFTPVLGLWALVMFGIAFVGPTAPYTMYGLGSAKSHGHFALVYLIGMIAMSFTAFSYARMATAFPEAGSTYAYASRTLHPVLGFFGGWVMILDYIMLPLISIVIVSSTAHKLFPEVPYGIWALSTAAFGTGLNLFGIRVTSRATIVWNAMLAASLLWFFTAAVRALLTDGGSSKLLSFEPFYNSATFSLSAVMSATPIAVLSFLGFDGVSTLAEDAKNPQRDIGRATVLTCFTCGMLFILGTYFGQLLRPDFTSFQSQETAFSEIGRRIGGPLLGSLIAAFVVGQALMSVIASQASASRMLFGMARDGKLPQAVFAYLHPRLNTPVRSILLMGVICLFGGLLMNLEQAADLVNFGACLGFMSVNLSALAYGFFHRRERRPDQLWRSLFSPLIGFTVCCWIWLSVSKLAMIIGFVWLGLGVLHHASLKVRAGEPAS